MVLVTATEMREMDRQTIESFGIPGRVLMENAGRGAATALLKRFNGLEAKRVAILAGRGNNGGDGFVIARCIAQKGIDVTVYLLTQADRVEGDAAANLKLLEPLGIPLFELPDRGAFFVHETSLRHRHVFVDAILGTGLQSDVNEYFRYVIEFINRLNKPVFAVDIPSGLNSDTGQPCGACIRARATATFAFPKLGQFLFPGASYCGALDIIDIGIPAHIADRVGPRQFLLTPDIVRSYFNPRAPETHKGQTGHMLVIAGAPGKSGAAAMTAMAAMRAGAGLVTLCVPKNLHPVFEARALEVMTVALPETENGVLHESGLSQLLNLLPGKKCLSIGPGIGTAESTIQLVHRVIRETTLPMVIDADAINCLAGNNHLLKSLKASAVLTPHPGEMARLLGITPAEVQKDRIASARYFATDCGVHIVLKGARTVIAHPDGRIYVNPTGNPGMASGGMGDVLTGIIAGLISQGLSPEAAVHAGVFLHGASADALEKTFGPFGYLASDVMGVLPKQMKKLLDRRSTDYAVTSSFS